MTAKIVEANVVIALGQIVASFNEKPEGITSLDLTRLSIGVYFLILESDTNEQKTITLIKE